uniref:ATP synthase complex subunit 8 n=1 Tax=Hierodula membranacea TaxID=516493 RepID=A0A6J3UCW2_9NEOP|nr:ATP synthase F0 subunit 8 [Hierodula membranacea]ALG66341.1 ATP synthase F0 subunit 8 [Hierodula membranacea]
MPQMMPLNWFMLFSLFSMLLILFNVMNFFTSYNKTSSLSTTKKLMKTLVWKW